MGAAVPLIIGAATSTFVPAISTGIAGIFGVAAGALTNVVAGALVGALSSAITGGDPLTGALFGGLGAGVSGMFGASKAAGATAEAATDTGLGLGETAAGALKDLSPGTAVASEGGGLAPAPTSAYDAVRISLDKGGGAMLESAPNEFASGLLPETSAFGGDFATSADPFKLSAGTAEPGLMDKIFSTDTLVDAVKGGGSYLMQQGMLEDKIAAEGEELRDLAEFKNTLKHQGITKEGQAPWMKDAIDNMYAFRNVSGTRAESLARGYSGRYSGRTTQAVMEPLYQQGTLFQGAT